MDSSEFQIPVYIGSMNETSVLMHISYTIHNPSPSQFHHLNPIIISVKVPEGETFNHFEVFEKFPTFRVAYDKLDFYRLLELSQYNVECGLEVIFICTILL